MKRPLRFINAVIAIAVAAPGVATAAYGDIIASYPAPAANPVELAAGGGYVYCFTNTPPYAVWKINPQTGGVLSSATYGTVGSNTAGLAYDGNYFWSGNAATDYITRFTGGGSVVSSFKTSWDFGYGLGWGDVHLWASEHRTNPVSQFVYEMRVDGMVLQSFSAFYKPYDIAWDGSFLWIPSFDSVQTIYKIISYTAAGTLVATLPAPAAEVRGAAFDGRYLWISTLADNGRLWKMDVAGLGVTPASWGRVKAVYR